MIVIVVPVSCAIVWARRLNLFPEAGNLLGRQVAQFERVLHEAGHDVARAGEHLQLSDVSHLPPGFGRHDGLDGLDEFRGGQQRIPPFGHGRRARVVREAADLDVVLVDADDAFDDANGDAGLEEVAALLDVQLQVAVEGARRQARIAEARRIAAKPANAVSAREAVVRALEVLRRADRPRAARLPIVPPSSFDQMTTCSGCRVVTPWSCSVRTASIADSDPRSPSKLPPLGTESMWEPKRIGLSERSLPARVAKMFAAVSMRGSSPLHASGPWHTFGPHIDSVPSGGNFDGDVQCPPSKL